MDARRRSDLIVLSVILLLAAALRVPGLGYDSFWYDEILTVDVVDGPITDVPRRVSSSENMPPLYYLLLNRWLALFGTSEFALRLPSALCGVAAVGVVAVLGARLFGQTAGRVAGVLLAVNPYHIAYSMEARAYSVMFLLAAVSCLLFVRLPGVPRGRHRVAYVLVSAAMLWVHPMSGFVLVAHNLFFVIGKRAQGDWTHLRWRTWLIMQGAILCLFGPWVPRLIELHGAGQPWMTYVPLDETLRTHARSIAILFWWLALAGLAIWKGFREGKTEPVVLALLLWLIPIVLPTLLSTQSRPIFTPRYGIAGLIGVTVLAGYAIAALRPVLRSILTASLVINSMITLRDPFHPAPAEPKPHLREAARDVATLAADGDAVLFTWSHDSRPFGHYYRGPSLQRVETLSGNRLWLIARPGTEPADMPGYQIVERRAYPGVNVVQLTRSD
jgi:mannosyltransferase